GAHRARRKRPQTLEPRVGDHDDFAIADIAYEMRADNIEGAGFRGKNVTPVEFAENERPDSERIAGADQLLVAERNESICALDRAQRLDKPVDQVMTPAARNKMQNCFGI